MTKIDNRLFLKALKEEFKAGKPRVFETKATDKNGREIRRKSKGWYCDGKRYKVRASGKNISLHLEDRENWDGIIFYLYEEKCWGCYLFDELSESKSSLAKKDANGGFGKAATWDIPGIYKK